MGERYDVPTVPYHGRIPADEAPESERSTIRELDRSGREGIVIESPDGMQLLKDKTSAANHADLAYAFPLSFDYSQDVMFRRIIREAFQAVEWEGDPGVSNDRTRDFGESILEPTIDTIREVDAGGAVGGRHTVRAEPSVVDALFGHLRDQGLHLEIEDDRMEVGQRVVTFVKRTQARNDNVRTYLDGTIVKD